MIYKLNWMREQWRISGFLKSFMAFSWIKPRLKVSSVAKWSNWLWYWWHANLLAVVLFKLHTCFIHTFVFIVRERQKIKHFSEISHQTCHSKAAMSANFIALVHSSYALFSSGRSQNFDSFWAVGHIMIVELWNYFKLLLNLIHFIFFMWQNHLTGQYKLTIQHW